jgi:phosphatidylserine decarboxylase
LSSSGVMLRKGEEMGMFEMGSTVVLIFECDNDAEFKVKEGEKVYLGQNIMDPYTQ